MTRDANTDSAPRVWMRRLMRLWVGLLGMALVAALVVASTDPKPTPPEDYGMVPEFALKSHLDREFGTANLRGNIWVANFIFTRCKTVCPIFSTKMAELQGRIAEVGHDVQLVSFSVDPDYDTPAVLAQYATQFTAQAGRWHFLTGPYQAIRSVVVDGMKMYIQDAESVDRPEDLMHGSHFVLVDGEHTIRGFYNVNNADTLDKVMEDINHLMAEGH